MTPGNNANNLLQALDLLKTYRTNSLVYTAERTPNLAINQLARQKKNIYKRLGANEESIKKALIITDWSFPLGFGMTTYPDANLPEKFCSNVQLLLNNGTPIFICRDGSLIPILSVTELQQAIKTIKPIHPAEVQKCVDRYNKEQAALMRPGVASFDIGDYTRIRELNKKNNTYHNITEPSFQFQGDAEVYAISFEDLINAYKISPDFLQAVLLSLQGNAPIKIASVGQNLLLVSKEIIQEVISKIIALVGKQITYSDIRELCKEFISNLEEHVSILNQLEYCNAFDFESKHSEKFQNLTLRCIRSDNYKEFTQGNFVAVRELVLELSELQAIDEVLKAYPKVARLDLREELHDKLNEGYQLTNVSSVEKLRIGIQNDGEAKLLNKFPNLVVLDVPVLNLDNKKAKLIVLEKLRFLRIHDHLDKIKNNDYIDLINCCPNLEYLHLWYVNFVNIKDSPVLQKHPHLKTLEISSRNLDEVFFASLTAACPVLENLKVDCSEQESKIVSLDRYPQNLSLKKLILKANTNHILNLIKAYPNLECLEIQLKWKQTQDLGGLPKLAKLKILKIEMKCYHFQTIARLIQTAGPALEVLEIKGSGAFIAEKFVWPHMPQLKQLNIEMLTVDLLELVNQCPFLVELTIGNLLEIRITDLEVLNRLQSLQAITLTSCPNEDILIKLLEKCSNIKKINFKCQITDSSGYSKLAKILSQKGICVLSLDSKSIEVFSDRSESAVSTTSVIFKSDVLNKEKLENLLILNPGYPQTLVLSSDKNAAMKVAKNTLALLFDKIGRQLITLQLINIDLEVDDESFKVDSLRELIISKSALTRQQLLKLLENFKNLKYLQIVFCKNINLEDQKNIKERFPHVNIEYLPAVDHEKFRQEELENYYKLYPNRSLPPSKQDEKSQASSTAKQSPATNCVGRDPTKDLSYPPGNKTEASPVNLFYEMHMNGFPQAKDYRGSFYNDYKLSNNQIILKPIPVNVVLREIKPTTNLSKVYEKNYAANSNCFYGQGLFNLNNNWVAIPGLSTKDYLLYIQANVAMPPLEVGYCKETNQYFVRLKDCPARSPKLVQIAAIMRSRKEVYKKPSPSRFSKVSGLVGNLWSTVSGQSPKVQFKLSSDKQSVNVSLQNKKSVTMDEVIAFCRLPSYQEDMFQFEQDGNALWGLINRLCEKGNPADRSVLFMLLAKSYNLKFRLNENNINLPPEILQDGIWKEVNLGGAANKVVTNKVRECDFNPPDKDTSETKNSSLQALPYSKRLKLDNSFEKGKVSGSEYCQQILKNLSAHSDKLNLLLNFDTALSILRFKTEMGRYLLDNSRRYHFLADLGQFSKTDVKPGKNLANNIVSSETVKFLESAKPGDVLIVDWSDYKDEHLGFNTLVDAKRHLKGVPIPDGVIVMVTLEKSKAVNLREDFYSRFRFIDDLPQNVVLEQDIFLGRCTEAVPASTTKAAEKNTHLETKEIKQTDANLSKSDAPKPMRVARLYADNNWQQDLLGKPKIYGKYIEVTKGPLIKALENKESSILLRNASWDLETLKEFQVFLSEALQQGKFTYFGVEYQIPKDFKVFYNNTPLKISGNFSVELLNEKNNHEWTHTLNSLTFDYFMQTIRIKKNPKKNKFFTQSGWLKQHLKSNEEMVILVTQNLPRSQWLRFTDAIKKIQAKNKDFKVKFIAGEGIQLPEELSALIKNKETTDRREIKLKFNLDVMPQQQLRPADAETKQENILEESLCIVHTKDMEFTAELLCKTQSVPHVISVGEKTTYSDLIDYFNVRHEKDEIYYDLPEKNQLLEKLVQGETVIIKGRVSPELMLMLETLLAKKPYLWVNGKREYVKGRLLLVTDTPKVADVFPIHYQHEFTPQESFKYLEKQFGEKTHLLKSIYDLTYIEAKNQLKLLASTEKKPDRETKDELQQRGLFLADAVERSTFVQIFGDTGVGKSHLVYEELPHFLNPQDEIFSGFSSLEDWAKPAVNGGKKILFIDEANLEDENFALLEGLANDPPGVFVNAAFYPSKGEHRVIFAGNFEHYGNRKKHRIFDFCEKLELKPLSPEALRAKTKEVLQQALGENKIFTDEMLNLVVNIFWKVYEETGKAVQNNAGKEAHPHPFTLRNLQSMALRFAVYWKRKNYQEDVFKGEIKDIAWMAAYDQARYRFPKEIKKLIKQKIISEFPSYKQKKAGLNIAGIQQNLKEPSYVLTKKRRTPFRTLVDQMAIRDLRAEKNLNYCGVRAMLFEGPSGSGKSSLAVQCLKELGFEDVSKEVFAEAGVAQIGSLDKSIPDKKQDLPNSQDSNTQTSEEKITVKPPRKFVCLTAADPEDLKNVLEIAFLKGYVVIVDELNLMPCENIHNYYLSGRNLKGKKAPQEGFFVIGTQNASSMPGRKKLSAAQANRFEEIPINAYTPEELEEHKPRLSPESILGFNLATKYAHSHRETVPTTRDLFENPHSFAELTRVSPR